MGGILSILGLSLTLLLAMPGVAPAQGGASMVKPMTQGDVGYLSGGIGLEEREAMEAQLKDYNLKLVFALASREYLSDIQVTIQDAGGKTVLSTETLGPWLFVKLAEGEYSVQAARGSEKKSVRVKVGEKLQTVNVLWK